MARRSFDFDSYGDFADEPAPATTRLTPRQQRVEDIQRAQGGTKKAAHAQARAEVHRSENARIAARTQGRQRFEASPAGQQRMRDVVDFATEEHNQVAREHPELGLREHGRINMSPAQLYAHYGFEQENRGPGMHERQIPGLEDPDALPQPKRWEEHTPEEQAHIQRAVKLRTGQDLPGMVRQLGAQLDQAHMRARSHGATKPYAVDFYHGQGSEDEAQMTPAQVLHHTSRSLGVSFGLVAATNADTSPNVKFRHQYGEDRYDDQGNIRRRAGEVVYPNAVAAEHAIRHVQQGGSPYEDPGEVKANMPSFARGVRPANLSKAMRRAHQVLVDKLPVGQTRVSRNEVDSGFGPKTSAYHNSWLVGTPDFTVSDMHTGGGGAFAHLGAAKPQAVDSAGNPKWTSIQSEHGALTVPVRQKSMREKALETKGVHAMVDHALRQAMEQRGLGHVRQAQAAQWGEEQLQRGEMARGERPSFRGHDERFAVDSRDSSRFPKPQDVYRKPAPVNPEQFGQGRLF